MVRLEIAAAVEVVDNKPPSSSAFESDNESTGNNRLTGHAQSRWSTTLFCTAPATKTAAQQRKFSLFQYGRHELCRPSAAVDAIVGMNTTELYISSMNGTASSLFQTMLISHRVHMVTLSGPSASGPTCRSTKSPSPGI